MKKTRTGPGYLKRFVFYLSPVLAVICTIAGFYADFSEEYKNLLSFLGGASFGVWFGIILGVEWIYAYVQAETPIREQTSEILKRVLK